MVHLERLVLRPEISHAYLEVRTLKGPVYAYAGIGGGNGPGDGFGPVPGVLAIVIEDADAVAGHFLGRVVGHVTVKGVAHRLGLVHLDTGTQDRHDAPAHKGGVHLRGTAFHTILLRPKQCTREQGKEGYDQ